MKTQMLGLAIGLMLVSMVLLGCAGPAKGAVLRSDKSRLTPNASEAETAQQVSGNSAFAFDLYQNLRDGRDGNLFYSPYSISVALAMTHAGARGETEQQIAETLQFSLTPDRLHSVFNGLDLELAQRGEGAGGKEEEGFRLNIINALWGQDGYTFLSDFLDILAEQYGAGVRLVDFTSAPEKARETINDWVSDQTEDRVEALIPEGAIDTWTRLVLVNAIYFDAAWLHPFEAGSTYQGPFHLLDGNEVAVPMMGQEESFAYAEGAEYQAVELLYEGQELSMVILLPQLDQFDAFEGSLSAGQVSGILGDLHPEDVHLTMPRFTFDSSFELAQTLSDMGMPDAFLYQVADFSGMDGSRELFIGEVLHKAFVSVDEAGTEAAAASAVVAPAGSALDPDPPIEVMVDRPFLFLIRDIQTGSILFVGRVVDPTGP
jgi:serpin B